MDGVAGWFMGILAAVIPGLGAPGPHTWNGYVEEDYVYASAPTAGTIQSIAVSEGQVVRAGDVLFVLDQSQQQASLDAAKASATAAQATAAAAQATLANLQTGQRPEEIAVTQAQLQKAQADLALAQQTLQRTKDLFAKGNASQSALDTASSTAQSAQAAVDTLEAQITVAQLPARDAQQQAAAGQLQAAQAQVTAAEAQVTSAQSALDLRVVKAPEPGRIERLFFKTGEVAGAGVPVVSLSGADTSKIEFYVSEIDRQQFALGDQINISCDGCAAGLTATITRFASDPQFTPPIIYSRDERSRLVFLTEATMAQQSAILPGQPVTIGLSK